MWGEFDISPLREASAFGAGIGRCVEIEIVAHKNGSQGEKKLTAQLQILKILSRHGIRVDRRSTSERASAAAAAVRACRSCAGGAKNGDDARDAR